MVFTDAQRGELSKPLDPKHVVKPAGRFGAKGDYIEGWHAIAEANRIFGHDGWEWTIDLRQDALTQGEDGKGQPQWQAAYTCISTVRAGGVTRQDVGFGSGFAKQIGDAIEGATKEAATDSLKRALRTFGHPFGLALYDKSRANVGIVDGPVDEGEFAQITTLLEQTSSDVRAFCEHFGVSAVKLLPASRFDEARALLNRKLRKAA